MYKLKLNSKNKRIQEEKTYECKGKERNNPSCINSNNNCEISFLRQETPLMVKRIERL